MAIAQAMAREGANVMINGFGRTDEIEEIRRPDQLAPIGEVDGWHIDGQSKRDIDAILARCDKDPVSPAIMAAPDRRPQDGLNLTGLPALLPKCASHSAPTACIASHRR